MKWYNKSWVLWLILILIPYIGIPFMWVTKRDYSAKKKIIFSVFFGVYAIIIASTSFSAEIPSNEKLDTEIKFEEVDNMIAYEIINSDNYVRDGKECTAYRVVIDALATETELREVFQEIVEIDNTYLRTVWFYELESDIIDIGSYTVAMIEELSEQDKLDKTPSFSKTLYSQEVIERLRNGS